MEATTSPRDCCVNKSNCSDNLVGSDDLGSSDTNEIELSPIGTSINRSAFES